MIDEFHRHEVMDRLHVARESIIDHIFYHAYTMQNSEVSDKISLALDCLMDAYQLAGSDKSFKD